MVQIMGRRGFEANFDIMDEEGYDLMIRGHDHRKDHALRPKKAYKPSYRSQGLDDPYHLDARYNHLITHGAWFRGEYVAIEDEKIRFESVDEK